jgi:hypothetical protein
MPSPQLIDPNTRDSKTLASEASACSSWSMDKCDTRFANKRSWKLFFLYFSHSVVAFWEFGI